MNFLEAIAVVLTPFLPVFLPGIFFIPISSLNEVISKGARIMLWSMSINTLFLMLGLLFGIPVQITFLATILISIVASLISNRSFYSRNSAWKVLLVFLITLLGTAIFTVPFLRIQSGLPTGDVQKTIIWAQESIATHHLPDYGRSLTFLNRDPVDFYTPGLHSLSALVLRMSPAPLTSISIFSIIIVVCIGWVTAALTKELFPTKKYNLLPLISVLLLMTEYRFLRYVREPGYHYQNAFGEFFLFGLILLFFSFIARKKFSDLSLWMICAVALFFTHQFSAFIGAFAFLFGLLVLAIQHVSGISHKIRVHMHVFIAGIVGVCAAGIIAILFGLIKKIPSLFTLHPHLASLVPHITDYPSTMGEVWFIAGIVGIVFLMIDKAYIFAAMAVALFALSQGPNFGIDIPPVRALFYSAVPLSIAGAYFFWKIGSQKKSLFIATTIIVIIATMSSVQRAYGALDHAVRTNSTLTSEQQYLINRLHTDKEAGGILIDDYDRRSASWLVLSEHPMMTRISSDLQTQMNEAGQSPVRNQLYMNQLDYEKIFALGSMPEINNLLLQHEFNWVTGVADSSENAFSHNPVLQEYATAGDIVVYKNTKQQVPCETGSLCEFLLRPSTLANDIGDDEDTFEHLEASIRTPRLSDPKNVGNTTYRETTSPIIPLEFNIGDYVQKIWASQSHYMFAIKLVKPVSGLVLKTAHGKSIPLEANTINIITMQPEDVQIDDQGFVTFTIDNPRETPVDIDLIALGL
ncbi:MAG TPA: hypothetical protein VLG69_00310 [Candidatus Andersenbacteria bacterium]|nr:hypothetical protein [Candidatus Andersenbacteria bacterium]